MSPDLSNQLSRQQHNVDSNILSSSAQTKVLAGNFNDPRIHTVQDK